MPAAFRSADGLSAHSGVFLDTPQRPLKSPKDYDLLPFFFVQDIAHVDEAYLLRRGQCPDSVPMAGFEVTLYGRIWVTPEVQELAGPGGRVVLAELRECFLKKKLVS